jgi:DNA polymerase-3 subunit epsilon
VRAWAPVNGEALATLPDRSVLVFDLETTGTDPLTARPVSVAVVLIVRKRPPVLLAHELLNPGVAIPPEASAVHGILDADVANARPWADVLVELGPAFASALAVAAYNAGYDASIWRRAYTDLGLVPPDVAWWCPLTWARSLWWGKGSTPYPTGDELVDEAVPEGPRKRSLTLTHVARFYSEQITAHDAAGDALTTARLMPHLRADLEAHLERKGTTVDPFASPEALTRWTHGEALAHERFLARAFGARPSLWADLRSW